MNKSQAELTLAAYLQSLTDKKAQVSDNRILAGSANKHNVKLLAQAAAKKGNAEFSKTMSSVAQSRTEEYRQRHQQGVEQRDNTYQAISNAKPEVREKISIKLTGLKKTDEHNAKVRVKNQERARPVIVPWGVFRSGKLAGDVYNTMNAVSNGKNHVSHHCKRNTLGYRFISLEEYIMLTGKEL